MTNKRNSPQYPLKIDSKLVFLNKKKYNLLKCINDYGSIKQASQKAKISYRSALNYIKNLENDLDNSVVLTQLGGKGGGGMSKLTENGKKILEEYQKIDSFLNRRIDQGTLEKETSNLALERNFLKVPVMERFWF
nr:LysR family transcriptional regulator [uncultured Methanobacterium sp.]